MKTLNNVVDLFSEIYNFKSDLLLLDTVLGGADAPKIFKQIGSWPETRHFGILIFSYKSCEDDFIESHSIGSLLPQNKIIIMVDSYPKESD